MSFATVVRILPRVIGGTIGLYQSERWLSATIDEKKARTGLYVQLSTLSKALEPMVKAIDAEIQVQAAQAQAVRLKKQ